MDARETPSGLLAELFAVVDVHGEGAGEAHIGFYGDDWGLGARSKERPLDWCPYAANQVRSQQASSLRVMRAPPGVARRGQGAVP